MEDITEYNMGYFGSRQSTDLLFNVDNKMPSKEDAEKMDQFIKAMQEGGMPLEDVRKIANSRIQSEIYTSSNYPTGGDDGFYASKSVIGRAFHISTGLGTGKGLLELRLKSGKFDFLFERDTSIGIERAIAEELAAQGFQNISCDYTGRKLGYSVRIYPADVNKVLEAYQEINKLGAALSRAPALHRQMQNEIDFMIGGRF